MREISVGMVKEVVARLCREACCNLPLPMTKALEQALEQEESGPGKEALRQILRNRQIAVEEQIPVCQDTGLAVVFVELGQDVRLAGGELVAAINEGVAQGYVDGFLRLSCVTDPLFERINTGDNTPAIIHLTLVAGDRLRLLVAPKGAGSENKSVLRMLLPGAGVEGVKKVVLEAVKAAGPNSCPPVVVGVGIGGNMELACLLAKRAAVRDVGIANADSRYAVLERELLEEVNQTGIGPQGLGGRVTAVAVHVEWAPTHIASLPCAVNINCNAARHAKATM